MDRTEWHAALAAPAALRLRLRHREIAIDLVEIHPTLRHGPFVRLVLPECGELQHPLGHGQRSS
jgi:hypothetical protein